MLIVNSTWIDRGYIIPRWIKSFAYVFTWPNNYYTCKISITLELKQALHKHILEHN
jgi:hypothetical protein